MADVTHAFGGMHLGRAMPEGQTCDLCSDPATVRRMGERDSFGAEWLDHCEPHDRALMEFGVEFTSCVECNRWFPLVDDDDRSIKCHVCRAPSASASGSSDHAPSQRPEAALNPSEADR